MKNVRSVTSIAAILTLLLAATTLADERKKERRSPSSVKVSAVLSKESTSLSQLRRGAIAARLRIENTSDDKIVLWPFLTVGLFDSNGKPVRRAVNIGRWGRRSTPSVIEGIRFVELEPGKTHEIPVKLDRYMYDANAITGWRLAEAGDYQLRLEYAFKREAAKKKYGKGCKNIDDKTKPWNQAVEIKKKLNLSLKAK